MKAISYFRFSGVLQQQGWITPAYVGVNPCGTLEYLSDVAPPDAAGIEYVQGWVLPGLPNAHSHAFQYAMAGLAEQHQPGTSDDFWTWRELMYECALALDPDKLEAIAAMLYSEMLRYGYTHVAEFHYLHHEKDGRPYNNVAELGERLLAAAATAGIKITLIPVYYRQGGFGKPANERQRRFISASVDDYLVLLEATRQCLKSYSGATVGFGVHSLRAVEGSDIIRTFQQGPRELPFHIHAAEQKKEVEDCLLHYRLRPVEWIIENLPLQEGISLVHCTHLNDNEVSKLAASRANVVLCPGTEGNLGDGFFRLKDFADQYGNFCIGTDSQISLNPMEDMRWLDYGQRLQTHKRNTFDDTSAVMLTKVFTRGRRAMGEAVKNFFEIGQAFDAVVFDADAPLLQQRNPGKVLQAILYTSDSSHIAGTIVDGKWKVQHQVHHKSAQIRKAYKKAITELAEK